jgi:hypothetical protein
LERHALKERGLAGSSFPDCIDMGEAVLTLDPEDTFIIPEINSS